MLERTEQLSQISAAFDRLPVGSAFSIAGESGAGKTTLLRTVAGLEPVHGVVRRLDDDYCDPLELRPDSTLGIPGLLQAVRAGHVVVANALGSGFLESPAVQGFLPAISRRLLGQELAMPSLPSWWCGEAAAFKAVLPTLAERVLRPAQVAVAVAP